jgi:hypothetical protein
MMVSKGIEDIDIRMPRDVYETDKDIPTFSAYLIAIVRDSEGKVVKVHRQRSRSPTANFISLILPIQYHTNCSCSTPVTNTGGTLSYFASCNTSGCGNISYPNAATNAPSYLVMIQVGSGQQSNPYSAHSLAAPIANGSGTGQLIYGTPSVSTNIMVSGSSAYFYISQTFNNSSGSTVTITEVGIITQIQVTYSNSTNVVNFGQLLVWYDVLSSAISVPNGGSVTIYYTFTVNP